MGKVCVIGLGYVGTVLYGCLSREGHNVIGVDIDETKRTNLLKGRSPIREKGLDELCAAAIGSGRAVVTDNCVEAVLNSEVTFVCVGTPSRGNGDQDLRAVERVCEDIGKALQAKTDYHVVTIRSTVLPGTVENRIVPLLEAHSGRKVGDGYGVCFQPEFLREGNSLEDYYSPPYTIIGGDTDRSVERVYELFRHIEAPFQKTSIGTAEMVKYCCNIFHALKITYANEIGRACKAWGLDGRDVMEIVCSDYRLNISPAYLSPGFAFGGSCLPKDIRGLLYSGKRADLDLPLIDSILRSNQAHIDRAVDTILRCRKRKVALIGLSFKKGTDDLRESPLVALAEQLIGKGTLLSIYDPRVEVSKLIGTNREYIESRLPHIAPLMINDMDAIISEAELVVLGHKENEFVEMLYRHGRPEQVLVDLVGAADRRLFAGQYISICW